MENEHCFMCAGLSMTAGPVEAYVYGFPLCRSHSQFLQHQEWKSEAAGNPAWKEVWDDTPKSSRADAESAILSVIVLNGSLRGLPQDIHDVVATHKLAEKYAQYV